MISEPTTQEIKPAPRRFLTADLKLDSWDSLKPYYDNLVQRKLDSLLQLNEWLADQSEMDSALQEHVGWLYIRMTCDTKNKELSQAYTFFVEEIIPHTEPYADQLNKMLAESPFQKELDDRYTIYLKSVLNAIRLFREENIPLNAEMTVKEQQYGEIAGAMTVEVGGKTLTLQQAANFLKDPDRNLRDEVFHKISSRRLEDKAKLDELFTDLVGIRTKVATNAGFDNFRDYKFVELDRFDYTPQDCLDFHESVRKFVVPVLNELAEIRRGEMKLDVLKPWDLDVDSLGRADLKPFKVGSELMEKTINCFTEIHPNFGEVTRTLQSRHHVDLDSRIGKAPGGYNYPLYETGIPFIFMNAVGSLRDVVTMVHEGGHAIQSMLDRKLEFVGFKELPSEVAELASMSMELISMEHWNHFFPDVEDLRRAKRDQLEGVLEMLPWIACVDHFQHWLYTHPQHSVAERTAQWKKLYTEFSSSLVDWSGNMDAMQNLWQKQLHLFEVPFYYVEYGMAQLGAIAMWRNYKKDPKQALEKYIAALSLGYTKPIPEVYKTAGIRFDFSENYIRELMDFVRNELHKV